MRTFKTLGVLVCIAAMVSCTECPEQETLNMADVNAEIATLEEAYSAASTNNDAEALLAYYADDAKSMAPNEPTRQGKAAIREATLKEMEGDDGNISLMEVQKVWAAGEIAVETGLYTVTNTDGMVISKGKYMSLFEKRDGKYVCVRDIWNSDLEHNHDDDDDDDDDEMDKNEEDDKDDEGKDE